MNVGLRILNRRGLDTNVERSTVEGRPGPKGRFLEAGSITASLQSIGKTKQVKLFQGSTLSSPGNA